MALCKAQWGEHSGRQCGSVNTGGTDNDCQTIHHLRVVRERPMNPDVMMSLSSKGPDQGYCCQSPELRGISTGACEREFTEYAHFTGCQSLPTIRISQSVRYLIVCLEQPLWGHIKAPII